MMAAKIRTMMNNIVRNEQDTHMFDTEEQELEERVTKEEKATKEEGLRSSRTSGYNSGPASSANLPAGSKVEKVLYLYLILYLCLYLCLQLYLYFCVFLVG